MIDGFGPTMPPPSSGRSKGPDAQPLGFLKELRQQVGRLRLTNQALWELLRDRLSLSDEDLVNKIHEVDVRDGHADGQLTEGGLRCPNCGRVSNAKHGKCLYCGQGFERTSLF